MTTLNRMRSARKAAVLALAVALMLLPLGSAWAIKIGDILKVGGWVYIMKNHADELDKGLNSAVGRKNLQSANWVTKVVPIVSIGQGGFIGAVQVAGPKDKIATTKAALQLETSLLGNDIRARIFIPIDSTNPADRVRRVEGVGTTALLDLRL